MQDRDFSWFIEHYQELYTEYGHKFLAIKNKVVLGVYDSMIDGVKATAKTEPLGTFIVQECNGDESAYTSYIVTPGIMI